MRLWMLLIALVCALKITQVSAEPVAYALDAGRSTIRFTYTFQGDQITGKIPISNADIVIDPQNVSRSRVRVSMALNRARAGNIFATDAMRSASVFYVEKYPRAVFVSRKITRSGDRARMQGDLTLRGVTRPVDLDVVFYRERNQPPGDFSRLILGISGTLSRASFGATGYSDMVGDRVDLNFRVYLSSNNR